MERLYLIHPRLYFGLEDSIFASMTLFPKSIYISATVATPFKRPVPEWPMTGALLMSTGWMHLPSPILSDGYSIFTRPTIGL